MGNNRSEISHIIVKNSKDENGNWIELNVSLGSWITVRPSQSGEHAVPRKKLGDIAYHWKVRVVGFVIGETCKRVDDVWIAHGYTPIDMRREEVSRTLQFPKMEVNCICSSDFKDKVPVESITSVLEVHHFSLGQLLFPAISMSSLKENGIWFHKYHYTKKEGKVGKLTLVDVPNLTLLSRSVCDMQILTAYRCMLAMEVGRMLTEKGGVRCGVKVLLPFKVFAYFFKDVNTLKVAPQTYTLHDVEDEKLQGIFFGNWKRKLNETGGQITECTVDTSSIIFRYRVPKQTLYCNFYVQRRKQFWERGHYSWKPVEEHHIRSPTMQLSISIGEGHLYTLDVEEEWSLLECRKLLEPLSGCSEFQFIRNHKKVGFRRECLIKCKDCLPPHNVRAVLEQ